jgi:MSHA biogenesis protein MshQ
VSRARLLLALLFLLVAVPARADTALAVTQSFRGNVNFIGTEATLRVKDTSTPCALVSNSSGLSATLSGLPSGATVLSAQLYWAGSGSTPDYSVTFDGVAKTADSTRSYTSTSVGNGFNYFGAAVDVTAQVKAKGNGSYTFGGLSVNSGNPWCASQGVLGGFALLVIYSQASEPFRMLNLYEGFQYFRNSSLTINLSNLNVPNPLPAASTARVGHITWEGDVTTSQGGEDFLFSGTALTDSINPAGDQFNSASSATGDTALAGVDFDIYTLKAPTIQAGQTSASTVYRTGADMVLLGAQIIAIPYVASADLAIGMTRGSDLRVGSTTNYSITITNNGPDAETGPVTVVDTLPSGLKLVSTSGTGWTCTNAAGSSGTTVVTCIQSSPIASGAQSPVLTVAASPTASGNYTNSATVSGKTGDTISSNNSVTNASSATDPNQIPAPSGLSVVFTRESCTSGQRIVVTAEESGCHRFVGPVTAGDTGIRIYVTAVVTQSGVQYATLVDTRDQTVPIDLMASCLPYSGVNVTYASLTLDCKGTWKSINVTIPANKPTGILPPTTAPSQFYYPDVGRITMSLRYSGTVMGTVAFISRPLDIRMRDVLNKDGFSDQLGAKVNSYAKSNPDPIAFAQSGEQLTLRVGALMFDGVSFAPSFGKEPTALKGILLDGDIDLDLRLDLFAADPKTAPVLPMCKFDALVLSTFATDQAFASTTALAGALDAKVRWYEAGYLGVTPWLSDYLGTGKVGGPPVLADTETCLQKRLVDSTRVLGRFYPEHFETEVTPNFDCLADMKCPAADASKSVWAVSGATYSKQPFGVLVNAYAPQRGTADNTPLTLFQYVKERGITLSGVFPAGVTAPPKGVFTPQALAYGVAIGDGKQLTTTAVYDFGRAFDGNQSRLQSQTLDAPVPLFVRASMPEKRPAASGKSTDTAVTSIAPSGIQYEDGVQVVAGRVLVGTVFGSEILRLPVTLNAQYWSGTAWLATSTDKASSVAAGIKLVACTRSFATTSTGSDCKANALAIPANSSAVTLSNGVGKLMLLAPGRGNVGTVDFMVTGGADGDWLPSTRARATYGLNKAPFIYLREVY